jgi:hypothetical protein
MKRREFRKGRAVYNDHAYAVNRVLYAVRYPAASDCSGNIHQSATSRRENTYSPTEPDLVNTCVNTFLRRKAKKEPPGLCNLSGFKGLAGRR